ncbi:uncharacterized protein LOC128220662 isoform X2 [Mya arenaria]|nr:uncharacterized protein LOC128220662 isoform X2 [Mya arenaria]
MDRQSGLVSRGNVIEVLDANNVVNLEIIQHQKVQLVLERTSNAGEAITAELFDSTCRSDVPCSSLQHTVEHRRTHSFLSLSVQPVDEKYGSMVLVLWVLVFVLSSILLTWMIRKWWKHKRKDDSLLSDGGRHLTPESADESTLTDEKVVTSGKHLPTDFQDDLKPTSMSHHKMLKSTRLKNLNTQSPRWPLYLVACSLLSCLVTLFALRGHLNIVTSDEEMATLKISFPKEKHIRHIRSYSTDPDLHNYQIATETSSNLVTRLQLLDLSPSCRSNLTGCRVHALCESENGRVQCRCNRGYYLKDLSCVPCRTTCADGFYMTKQCSATGDVVCKPCTQCSGTTYEAAICTSTQDTICIDVTFPLKQFQSRIASLKELVALNESLSKNVFLERLQGIRRIEEYVPVSSNMQAFGFTFIRPETGLSIDIKLTRQYLIPEYVDIDYQGQDDFEFLNETRNNDDILNKVKMIRKQYCRHPLPDYYELTMQLGKYLSYMAREIVCDSQNSSLYPCPPGYNDGDKYVLQAFSMPCRKLNTSRDHVNFGNPLSKSNTILCPGNSELARDIFQKLYDGPAFHTFPSEECKRYEETCGRCLMNKACFRGTNATDCCNLECHGRSECQLYYSDTCPPAKIECATGNVLKFGLMSRYHNIRDKFACHLQHKPPEFLYEFSYEPFISGLNISLGRRTKRVEFKNFTDHMDGYLSEAFLRVNHITGRQYDNEVILIGSFRSNMSDYVNNYSLHKLKDPYDFIRGDYNIYQNTNGWFTKIQFERPFLYSTQKWQADRCHKNLSQIIPSQSIYDEYGEAVPGAQKRMERSSYTSFDSPAHVYEVLLKDTEPRVAFSIPENESILSHYKDRYGDSKIRPWTLQGEVTWDMYKQLWNITVRGSISLCPGIFSVEVFLENIHSRLAVYNMFVDCPHNFSTTFTLRLRTMKLVDVFIVVMNDTSTSHRLVLSSIQQPQLFAPAENEEISKEMTETGPWLILLVILAVCLTVSLFLLMFYIYCNKHKPKPLMADLPVPKPDLGPQITLLQHIDKFQDKRMSWRTKCIMFVLGALYLTYAFIFTFTALFGVFHIIQGSSISEVSVATNVSTHIQTILQTNLDKIIDNENTQKDDMLKNIKLRLTACNNHLKKSLNESKSNDINSELSKTLSDMFKHSGKVNSRLNDFFAKQENVYGSEVDKFYKEYNKTLHINLNKLQNTYALYLKSVAENKWFIFPKQRFMQQQLLRGRRLTKVTDDLAGFLQWLEIDKVQEIFEIKEILFQRVVQMMPKLDFSKLLNESDAGEDQASFNLELNAAVNKFQFTYSKQESSLNKIYLTRDFYDTEDNYESVENKNTLTNIRGIIYPVFITVFLLLDMCLIAYRLSWMTKSIHYFKNGLEDRVPCNSITRKIYFILTGRDIPKPDTNFDDPYDQFKMMQKKNFWKNRQTYFLYCQSPPRRREEILNEIMEKERLENPRQENPADKKNSCRLCGEKILKTLYGMFLSAVFWRLVLMCGFVLILCLVAKATNDLVTMESAMFLLDTNAMVPILERQYDISSDVVSQYGAYLNDFLTGYKRHLDGEVQLINNILISVAERQKLLLNTVISDMCNLAGGEECYKGVDLVTIALTSCNFLPLHTNLNTGLKSSLFLEAVQHELSPLVTNIRSILFGTIYLLLTCACMMIVCQIAARVIYVYLRNSDHLKLIKIYQLPGQCSELQDMPHFSNENEKYENQSVIAESFESGVCDMNN